MTRSVPAGPGNSDAVFYHREAGPVSIDLLRSFLADGWRLVAWPADGSRIFALDLARRGR